MKCNDSSSDIALSDVCRRTMCKGTGGFDFVTNLVSSHFRRGDLTWFDLECRWAVALQRNLIGIPISSKQG